MIALLSFGLAILFSPFRSRWWVEVENLALRHQVMVVCTENVIRGYELMESAMLVR